MAVIIIRNFFKLHTIPRLELVLPGVCSGNPVTIRGSITEYIQAQAIQGEPRDGMHAACPLPCLGQASLI